MQDIINSFAKEYVEKLLNIGEVKTYGEEIPYLSIDADVYLESNINQDEEIH